MEEGGTNVGKLYTRDGMGGRNHPNWYHESHPLGSEWHIRGGVGGAKSHSGAQGLVPNRTPQETSSRCAWGTTTILTGVVSRAWR